MIPSSRNRRMGLAQLLTGIIWSFIPDAASTSMHILTGHQRLPLPAHPMSAVAQARPERPRPAACWNSPGRIGMQTAGPARRMPA